MKKKIIRFLLIVFLQLLLTIVLFGQHQVTNNSINSGGGTSSNSEYKLQNSVGVQYISSINNNEYKLQHGFWIVGGSATTSMNKDDIAIPTKFELYQNYPNPFNPTTVIKFGLPETSNVTIAIYDMLGQRVSVILDENKTAGYHEINWDASNLSSGVFLITISAVGTETGKSYNQVKKALLLK
jgi:hypothetical protein